MTKTDLRLYTATADEDLLIGQWYLRMAADGDLDGLFTAGSRTLAELFRLVSRPKTLVYAVDGAGIWLALWAEPMLTGAFLGLWCRQDRRRSRIALHAVLDAYAWYFASGLRVVYGVTKQPKILDAHRALGYAVIDHDPGLFDGQPTWIVRLRRTDFERALTRFRRPSYDLMEATP